MDQTEKDLFFDQLEAEHTRTSNDRHIHEHQIKMAKTQSKIASYNQKIDLCSNKLIQYQAESDRMINMILEMNILIMDKNSSSEHKTLTQATRNYAQEKYDAIQSMMQDHQALFESYQHVLIEHEQLVQSYQETIDMYQEMNALLTFQINHIEQDRTTFNLDQV